MNTLCASSALDAAWCSRIEFTSTCVSLDEPPITTCKYFDLMLVPAQATACITAGPVVVTHDDGRIDVGRFARDDSDGSTIIVLNSSHASHVDVISIVHDGAMRLRRTHVRFRSVHHFRLVLLKKEAVAVNTALIRSESLIEYRTCPMCQRTGERPCSCRLAFISPVHPADFATFRANLHALSGAFSGHCLKFNVGDSSPSELLTRTCVSPTSSQHLISNIAHSAVQYLVASGTKSTLIPPTPSSIPSANSFPFSPISAPTPTATLDEAPAVKHLTFAESVESIIQQSLSNNQLQHEERPLEHDALASFFSGAPQNTPRPQSAPPAQSSIMNATTSSTLQTSPISQLSEQHCTWPMMDIAAGSGEARESKSADGGIRKARFKGSLTMSSVSTPAVEKEVRKPIRRARRTTKKVVTEEMLREREARRQLRIFKNRQAAARSNQRRKMQNDRLKSALADARGRALQLRDRHMVLREENLRLKMALLM